MSITDMTSAEATICFTLVMVSIAAYISGYALGVRRTLNKIYSELPKKQAE